MLYVTGNGQCGNCANDCCCKCNNAENCHYCKVNNDKPPNWCYSTRCSGHELYTRHYVCFNCNNGFKKSLYNYPSKKDATLSYDFKCNKCKKNVLEIPPNIRFPKATNIAQWKLLEKILQLSPFENCKEETLGNFWYKHNGFNFTIHMPRKERIQFNIPHHIRDYNEWINYMKNTKFISYKKQ
jgi:hypothetical protein